MQHPYATQWQVKLRRNGFGEEGWATIFTALRDSKVSKISTWDLYGESGIAENVKVEY